LGRQFCDAADKRVKQVEGTCLTLFISNEQQSLKRRGRLNALKILLSKNRFHFGCGSVSRALTLKSLANGIFKLVMNRYLNV
jgi:hypothetical protein